MNKKTKPIPVVDIKAAIAAAMDNGDYDSALILSVGIYLAYRCSDWRLLKWGDVIDDGKVVDEVSIFEKKTKNRRKVPVSDSLRSILARVYNGQHPEVYLFRGKRGPGASNRPISVNAANSRLASICAKYGLPPSTTHALRKSTGDHLFHQFGANFEALLHVQQLYNHKNVQTTIHYLDVDARRVNDFIKNL